jgi:tRNA nucleotidyltransferase (CCA-adding enzyme)
MELEKLLVSPHPEMIRLAWECGITKIILPEFDAEMDAVQNNAHHKITVGEHTIRTMMAVEPDRILRVTMLLHDSGKPVCQTLAPDGVFHYHGHAAPGAVIAKKVMERLKYDKATERTVVQLIQNHSLYPELTPEGVRRAVVQIGEDLFPLFLKVKRADIGGQSEEVQQRKFEYMDQVELIYRGILERGDCLSLKRLAVTGDDLIAMGVPKGKRIGKILNTLLDEVLADP